MKNLFREGFRNLFPKFCLKHLIILSSLLIGNVITVSASATPGQTWNPDFTKGETVAAKGNFNTYEVPDGYPYWKFEKPEFNVRINGRAYCGMYEDRTHRAQQMVFTYFDFTDGREQTVEVFSKEPFTKFRILPEKAEIFDVEQTGPQSLRFKITKAGQNLTLVFDDQFQDKGVLHLFCNRTEVANKNVTHYYGPGYHNLKDLTGSECLVIKDDETVFIAPGAVVDGAISLESLKPGGGIFGQGMLASSTTNYRAINSYQCTGGTINDIIVHSRCNNWQVVFTHSANMSVKRLKIISAFYRSNDGIDINGCENLSFADGFIRAADDCVAIKGLAKQMVAQKERPANTNIHFTRMQLWSDSNNAFGIGQEARAAKYENISFTDSDILFHWDDIFNSQKMWYQSALNICFMEGTYAKNILFDNIRLHWCMRAITIGWINDFYWGCIKSVQSDPGDISNIVYRNITSAGGEKWPNTDEVRLQVWHGDDNTPTKAIHDVTFENVNLHGIPLQNFDDTRILTNAPLGSKLLYDINFK